MDQQWVVDSGRIRSELGYVDVVQRERALHHTVTWERANPPTDFPATLFDYSAEDRILAGG